MNMNEAQMDEYGTGGGGRRQGRQVSDFRGRLKGKGAERLNRQVDNVDDAREHINQAPDEDRPAGSFMEGYILVKGNNGAKGSSTHDRDQVPTDGKQDENNINMTERAEERAIANKKSAYETKQCKQNVLKPASNVLRATLLRLSSVT
ncbi:hypothetical protein L218DRAFT_944731 [Marasmius fiardii PR-910]|nr:hypothetical protein L218DRAFT_944731 [Marasmius fiardii PR-910]